MGQTYAAPASDPRDQVNLPATLLMVFAGIGIVLQIVGLLLRILGIGIGAMSREVGPGGVAELMSGAIGIVAGILGILIGGFIIYAAMQMKELRGYPLAMAASIVSMVPCLSPCCCIGLPIGIWCLVVLLRPEVKAAFR
jgi:hypothetical protein